MDGLLQALAPLPAYLSAARPISLRPSIAEIVTAFKDEPWAAVRYAFYTAC